MCWERESRLFRYRHCCLKGGPPENGAPENRKRRQAPMQTLFFLICGFLLPRFCRCASFFRVSGRRRMPRFRIRIPAGRPSPFAGRAVSRLDGNLDEAIDQPKRALFLFLPIRLI